MLMWNLHVNVVVFLLVMLGENRISQVEGFRPTGAFLFVKSRRAGLLSANPSALCKTWVELTYRSPRTTLFSAVGTESLSREAAENQEGDMRFVKTAFLNNTTKNMMLSEAESCKDLPWSDSQEWALRDNVPKHIIQVAFEGRQVKRLIRWRTLLSSTPELAGYPIDFVIERFVASSMDGASDVSTEVLPLLDNFRFETNGGLSGLVYGVRGVQDGTRIRTDPVSRVEHSIPLGYVATEDNSVVYELGRPDESPKDMNSVADIQRGASSMISSNHIEGAQQGLAGIFDPDLVQLGGLTAVVLTGAWAMQTLSHHLTVNIFWV